MIGHLTDDDIAALKAAFPGYRIAEIADEVSAFSGIPAKDILSKSRTDAVIRARDCVIWIYRRETQATLGAIARAFGMDHTTIAAALEREGKRRG
jgi:chromosomal replication initiation ATPase DnaA